MWGREGVIVVESGYVKVFLYTLFGLYETQSAVFSGDPYTKPTGRERGPEVTPCVSQQQVVAYTYLGLCVCQSNTDVVLSKSWSLV